MQRPKPASAGCLYWRHFWLCVFALIAGAGWAPGAVGQDLVDGAEVDLADRDRTFFVNRLMRQLVIPANDPANPNVIPLGYEAELPDTSASRVAASGEHFWLFTSEMVDRYDLYWQWEEAGKPVPVGDFARSALPSGANLVANAPQAETTDTAAQAAEPPPTTAPPKIAEPGVVNAPWWRSPTALIVALLAVALIVAAFAWSKSRKETHA